MTNGQKILRDRVREVRLRHSFKIKFCKYCKTRFRTEISKKVFCKDLCRNSYNLYRDIFEGVRNEKNSNII